MSHAYMLLRGKNLETGKYSDNTRNENFATFKDALDTVMNLNNWHAFLNCVNNAVLISIISSLSIILQKLDIQQTEIEIR